VSDLIVVDDLHPEDNAMLQALYSRSPQSVRLHLEKVKHLGSGKFMDQYYVGYGHQSIGDCGTTTLFIEYVSMLTAKAIQDSPLYNGQEASTRYIDMSKQPVLNPLDTAAGQAIQHRWMSFYTYAMAPTIEHLKRTYPLRDGENQAQYEKAIKARAFDVLRSFLPAGCTTFVSWSTTLRHAADRMEVLRHYPLSEVRDVAESLLSLLQEHYPHSFGQKLYDATEQYNLMVGESYLYQPLISGDAVRCTSNIDEHDLRGDEWIMKRPPKVRLPHCLDDIGQVTYTFNLDFGSFRDLQRHRNGVCRMPLLSTEWGFNQWYYDQLPADLRKEAMDLVYAQRQAITDLEATPAEKQFYVAMGFNVPCKVTRGLPGTLYLIELRTSKTVHPTMRKVAQEMARTLQEKYPILPIHADMSPDDWDIRRGAQDIVAR
jgi:thymidylate synthase ThyX